MYLTFFQFFGLSQNPFNVNPDPTYLFLYQETQSVLAEMASAIEARKGLIVLTGEVGTGKTTLLNHLIRWLQSQRMPTAFIFNPRLEVNELFDLMLADFGVPVGAHRKASALGRLHQWLFECYRLGTNPVLIVDEAQGLPVHVLEEIRMLLNQETPHEKLLQIVLSGQPELEEKLRRPALRQIRQRISLRCQTTALTREQAHGYIQNRLRIAGARGRSLFTPEAVDAIHLYSRGIPRVMNLLCEYALIWAYRGQIQQVPAYVVGEAACQLQLDDAQPAEKSPNPARPPSEHPLESFFIDWANSCRAQTGSAAAADVLSIPAGAVAAACALRARRETELSNLTAAGVLQPSEAFGARSLPYDQAVSSPGQGPEGRPASLAISGDSRPEAKPGMQPTASEPLSVPADQPSDSASVPASASDDPRVFMDRTRVRYLILNARERIAGELRSISPRAKSMAPSAVLPALARGAESLLHWLRQPMPAIKTRRTLH